MNDIDAIIHLSLEGAEDVSKIREFILSLALKGKLVNQDPNDESADALLSRLRTDKSRSSEPGKRTSVAPPDLKPLSESHHPYPLPIGWCWVKLSSVGYINPRSSLQDDTQVGFVPMSLIKEGYANEHGFERKTWVEIKKNYTHFQDGDVGVAKITPCFENRKSCVFKNLPNGSGAGSTELYIFRNIFGVFDPNFLLMLFKTEQFISNGKGRMTGTAGQQRIPRDYFSDSPIPLPPLTEQKRISQKVRQLMQLCDDLERKCMLRSEILSLAHSTSIKRLTESSKDDFMSSWKFIYDHFNIFYSAQENVDELKKAILTLAMKGKLVPQDDNDTPVSDLLKCITEIKRKLQTSDGITKNNSSDPKLKSDHVQTHIPDTWKYIPLEEYADIIMGQSPKSSSYNTNGDGLPFFQGKANFGDISPTVSKWCNKPSKIAPPNSILISVRAPVGPTNICPFEACIGRGLAAIVCLDKADNMYLMYYLRSIESIIASYGTGSTFKAIKKEVLQNIMVPVPPHEEQKRIVAKLEHLLSLCDKLAKCLKEETNTKLDLIQALMSKIEEL
jgi:type I restriction enzyme S subunit